MSHLRLFLIVFLVLILAISVGLLYVGYTIEPTPQEVEQVVPDDRFPR